MSDRSDGKSPIEQAIQEEFRENTFFGRYWLDSHESVSWPLKLTFGMFFALIQTIISALFLEFAILLLTNPILLLIFLLLFSLFLNGAFYLQYKKGKQQSENEIADSVEGGFNEKIIRERGRETLDKPQVRSRFPNGNRASPYRRENSPSSDERRRISELEYQLQDALKKIQSMESNSASKSKISDIESRLGSLEDDLQQIEIQNEPDEEIIEDIRKNEEFLTRIYQRLLNVEDEIGLENEKSPNNEEKNGPQENQSSRGVNSEEEELDKDYELE